MIRGVRERAFRCLPQDYLRGATWDTLYPVWSERMADFAVPLAPLFTEVTIQDPNNQYSDMAFLDWWPVGEFEDYRRNVQRPLREGTKVLSEHVTPQIRYGKGVALTVRYLWDHRDEREKVAAILMSGSFFTRLRSGRRRELPETWPHSLSLEYLARLVDARWLGKMDTGWGSTYNFTFPTHDTVHHDSDYGIMTPQAMVRYLAEEHAAALLQYRLVNIQFVPTAPLKLRSVHMPRSSDDGVSGT